MLSSFVTALAVVASASALVVPRATPPSGWRADILESYDAYHTRYMAINCQLQHNKPFFDLCCHPLKKGETLAANRDPSCVPANASSTAPAANVKPTPSPAQDDSDDCDDEEEDDDENDEAPVPAPTPKPVQSSKPPVASPKPSSTAKPTTVKPSPAKTTTSTPKPTNHNSGSTISGGFATFYYQHGTRGACGQLHGDGELIAAMDTRRYGDDSKQSSLCGKQVEITNTKNGKSVTVTIADACPTCKNSNSIDLSEGAFTKIAPKSDGMVPIEWRFV